jgi:hypothetical protein
MSHSSSIVVLSVGAVRKARDASAALATGLAKTTRDRHAPEVLIEGSQRVELAQTMFRNPRR